jgi:hypothetical protein
MVMASAWQKAAIMQQWYNIMTKCNPARMHLVGMVTIMVSVGGVHAAPGGTATLHVGAESTQKTMHLAAKHMVEAWFRQHRYEAYSLRS